MYGLKTRLYEIYYVFDFKLHNSYEKRINKLHTDRYNYMFYKNI